MRLQRQPKSKKGRPAEADAGTETQARRLSLAAMDLTRAPRARAKAAYWSLALGALELPAWRPFLHSPGLNRVRAARLFFLSLNALMLDALQ
jgi:hypothetical protein